MRPSSHLTSCTPNTSNVYLTNSLAAALSDPALYRLLTFQVPIFIPLCLLRDAPLETLHPGDQIGGVVYLRIVLSPEQTSHLWKFLNISVLQGRFVSTSPNPQAEGPLLIGWARMLIQFIRSYPHYRRPFDYPQPEDAPCCGDRDPLHGMEQAYHKRTQKVPGMTTVKR